MTTLPATTATSLPEPICKVVRLKMLSCEFYTWASMRGPRGKIIYKLFRKLTVGDCEQLTEYHLRRAHAAMNRYHLNRSDSTAQTAADHIFCANRYRLQYYELLGMEPDKRDMPFPLQTEADRPRRAK